MDLKQKVGFPYDYDIFFAKLLSLIFRKKLVFEPLISTYETAVKDIKAIRENFCQRQVAMAKPVITAEYFGKQALSDRWRKLPYV